MCYVAGRVCTLTFVSACPGGRPRPQPYPLSLFGARLIKGRSDEAGLCLDKLGLITVSPLSTDRATEACMGSIAIERLNAGCV